LTAVFITGLSASTLDGIAQALHSAGLPGANALSRDPQISLSSWHHNVLSNTPPAALQEPGRMWDQLAGELFVANIGQSQWACTDPRILPLLDYWAATRTPEPDDYHLR
jgi:hypothetical protein